MSGTDLWKFAADALQDGVGICLVTMVQAEGSGPNRPGCKAVVTADGRRAGTVGGGVSEYKLFQAAEALLESERKPNGTLLTMRHRDSEDGTTSGMICSGTQVFVLNPLFLEDLETIQQIIDCAGHGKTGKIQLTKAGLLFKKCEQSESGLFFDADIWEYEETVGELDIVTLIGGGHVALALSPILRSLGLYVIVLDNRPELATMKANTTAHEIRIVDYDRIRSSVPAGSRSYVCIMTFGHQYDEAVLEQLIDLDLRYLGMMGSAHKISTIRERLISRGFDPKAFDSVHAPIGIEINSNTPEEIAVSIAAEIIAVRNET